MHVFIIHGSGITQENVPSLMSLFLKQERFEAMVGDLDRMGCVSVAKKNPANSCWQDFGVKCDGLDGLDRQSTRATQEKAKPMPIQMPAPRR